MTIGGVMKRDVVSATPDAPLDELVARMHRERLSCVVVCEDGRPIGIISERDLVRVLADGVRERAGGPLCAADLMSAPVIGVDASSRVEEAARLMKERGIRRLPVIDAAGRLVGLVTRSDLLEAYTKQVETRRDDLERIVEQRTRSLVEANRRLEELSTHDVLLGIGNRRSMELALDQTHAVAQRYGHIYSVALFDVDHFKRFNDTYGHLAGDDALRAVARTLLRNKRDSDTIHRYGGEEILVVLPDTGVAGARIAAERGRSAVEQMELRNERATHGIVTVSAGLAGCCEEAGVSSSWRDVVERADAALYRAKQLGRNRVEA